MSLSPELLYLVRHARSKVDRSTSPAAWGLTDRGRAEAAALAHRLENSGIDLVVSSDELKAIETADVVAGAFGIAHRVDEGLREQGGAHSQWVETEADFVRLVEDAFARPDEVVIGNESMDAAAKRFEDSLRPRLERAENVMVVAHGRVISAFVANHNEIDVFELWDGLEMPALITLTRSDLRLVKVTNHF
jgi:broad specificity phosphatase PhoE